ncbi:mitochondrial 37S ribosomal protein MRP51 [Sugiyamaella lignohabitans]|uniref:Mitochondrial 37S ribosomal protein MRP51 n=1 Tax=Sugiyamaella lignohabitans TaxID=796027 RepID=A0A167DJC2_9ASCO|nr:mitochondrial 37S ribosomal protein MRP51 [Sugiyamaella lignohabitans]ANB12979.1 mitochondrial 37S ribosomal protein MRP51 [Sugiyamaella lignohabitans]
MSQFPSLLRNSRVVGLYKSASDKGSAAAADLIKNKWYPVDQVVGTTAASFHKRNWGLKSPIPRKHKSLYLNVSALDSEVGLAQFDGNTGFHRKLQRFREMQVPLELAKLTDADSHFKANSKKLKSIESLTKKEVRDMNLSSVDKRLAFREYLAKTKKISPDGFRTSSADSRETVASFLGLDPGSTVPFAHNYRHKMALGLSYKLKGSLINTPEGIRTTKPVPGRVLDKTYSGVVGIGGFVSNSTLAPGMVDRTKAHNFIINKASMDDRGHVSFSVIAVDAIRPASRTKLANVESVLRDQPISRRSPKLFSE